MDFEQIAEWLRESQRAVVFTGAGISTESGIPDFRSPGGVWARNKPVYYDEFLASADSRHEYWRQKSEAHADFSGSVPNVGHRVLASWEQNRILQGIITQNIDGLHQDAGSRRVIELHGTARFVDCLSCAHRYEVERMVSRFQSTGTPPACDHCGGVTKHATISFGQQLQPEILDEATSLSRSADVMLAIGSSLVVEPAASLPRIAQAEGARLVILNRDETPLDHLADQVIRQSIGEALQEINTILDT
jgi:NAD-dependent deacetylase